MTFLSMINAFCCAWVARTICPIWVEVSGPSKTILCYLLNVTYGKTTHSPSAFRNFLLIWSTVVHVFTNMLPTLVLQASHNIKLSNILIPAYKAFIGLSPEDLRVHQHCIAGLSAVVSQLAPKKLAEGWKIDVVIWQYIQDDRFQDISMGACPGMDAYQLLQRETSQLCSK